MNKRNYDSEFCGNLPINFINSIQDYGYLIVLDRSNNKIIQVSENLAHDLLLSPSELLELPLEALFENRQLEKLLSKINGDRPQEAPLNLRLSYKEINLDLLFIVHIQEQQVILEMETVHPDTTKSFVDTYQDIKALLNAIDEADSLVKACESTITAIHNLAGFDSVLLYRFDEEWNGTVLAEVNSASEHKYLGLKFPASDIPKKAREMYLKNIYRLIPNRNYQPVRLFPVINSLTNGFTDLAECNLRAVPGVHLEYMANMGIKASMSIRVIKDGRLWGLISCHHTEEKYLTYEQCAIFELFSTIISNKIASMINQEDYHFDKLIHERRNSLIEGMYKSEDFATSFFASSTPNILDLFNLSGAIAVINNKTQTIGTVMNNDQIENLILWCQAKGIDKVYATNHFSDAFDEANDYIQIASGIVIIPVNMDRGEYVFLLRPEVVQTINWGGNPNEAIQFEADGKKYHPRNSFEIWKEVVKNTSLPWHPSELEAAKQLKSVLFEFTVRHYH